MRRVQAPPEQFHAWDSGMWRPWYAAVWAESAVAAGHQDAPTRIHRARLLTLDNPTPRRWSNGPPRCTTAAGTA